MTMQLQNSTSTTDAPYIILIPIYSYDISLSKLNIINNVIYILKSLINKYYTKNK